MAIEEIKQLYVENGFAWTPHLEGLMRQYAGKTFDYPYHIDGRVEKAWFYDPTDIQGGTWGGYKLIAEYLGEEVTPIGRYAGGHEDLFLTESGRLIGASDYLLLSWSTQEAPNWQDSITRLLRGETPQQLGVVDTPDD